MTLKSLLRRTPVFGGLAHARGQDFRNATNELTINLLASTFPIWIGALILYLSKSFEENYFIAIHHTVRNGELSIYAAATVAPLTYFVIQTWREKHMFPNALGLIFSTLMVFMIACSLFGFLRAIETFESASEYKTTVLYTISYGLYVFSLTLIYVAYVYRNLVSDGATHVAHIESATYQKEYAAHRNREQK